jgi:transcriptional regulator with XRE-family HTH domain
MPASISPSRLRAAREAACVSGEQAAVKVHRSLRTINGYEAGEHEPPAQVVAALARLYGVPITDLVERDGEAVAS